MRYEPKPVPSESDMKKYLHEELRSISNSLTEVEGVLLPERNVSSSIPKPRDGMIILADGVNFNPGNGAGYYGRHGGVWVPLGGAGFHSQGTFVPVFTATTPPTGVTYTTQLASYTKLGRLVFVSVYLNLSSKGTGGVGDVIITGLPFTALNNGIATALATFHGGVNLNAGYTQATGYTNTNSTQIKIRESGDSVVDQDITWANMADTSKLYIAGCYETAA